MSNAPDTRNVPKERAPKKLSTQIAHSVLGEIAGYCVSIGSVYLAQHLLPYQTRAFTHKLAEKIGRWRHTDAQDQLPLAKEAIDVTLMNLGGLSNMTLQFFLHRLSTKPEDKAPLMQDLGRIIVGRVIGTTTAIGTLAAARTYTPEIIKAAEHQLSHLLGGTHQTDRFSELFLSSTLQSAGALAGNIPSQLAYDKLIAAGLAASSPPLIKS